MSDYEYPGTETISSVQRVIDWRLEGKLFLRRGRQRRMQQSLAARIVRRLVAVRDVASDIAISAYVSVAKASSALGWDLPHVVATLISAARL